jgi:hypothetical protein
LISFTYSFYLLSPTEIARFTISMFFTKPPIFVVGNPRSGTTLLRLMLTCHPDIVVPPECGFALWLRPAYADWAGQDSRGPRLEAFLDDLFKARKYETWNEERASLRQWLRQRSPIGYAELVEGVYAHYVKKKKHSARRFGDKNNFHIHHLQDLISLFPNCQIINIVRDGRDVACSYRQIGMSRFSSEYQPRLPQKIEDIALEWMAAANAPQTLRSGSGGGAIHTLRFEDLIIHPEDALSSLCGFLGEDYHGAMLNYHRRNRDEGLEPSATMEWKMKTIEPIDQAVVGRYREALSAHDVKVFESIAGPVLAMYGYDR